MRFSMFHWYSRHHCRRKTRQHLIRNLEPFTTQPLQFFSYFFQKNTSVCARVRVEWFFHGIISGSFNGAASFIRRPRVSIDTASLYRQWHRFISNNRSGAFDESNRSLWLNLRPTFVKIVIYARAWVDTVAREKYSRTLAIRKF